jgi:hypothetical protein
LFGGDIRGVGTGSEATDSVSGYGRGLVRDASMKARIRSSRYKCAGSTVKGNTVLTTLDCEGSSVGVDGPASSRVDIDEGRVEGKLTFRQSIASSIRPERMLT